MILWRQKLAAFGVHFVLTALLGAAAAALIFLVWFPQPFATMVGGTELFMLVVGCDLALGPLMSLVIYDSRKSRRKLVLDYTIVGILQLAALLYGVWVVAGTRPVFVAFSQDRLEVVTAREIAKSELAAARDSRFGTLSWTGPRYVYAQVPPADRQDALFQAVYGNEVHQRPKFFVPYADGLATILARAQSIEALVDRFPAIKANVDAALGEVDVARSRLRWLPVHHRTGFWTAFVDSQTGMPVSYVPLDSYDGIWREAAN